MGLQDHIASKTNKLTWIFIRSNGSGEARWKLLFIRRFERFFPTTALLFAELCTVFFCTCRDAFLNAF